MKYLVLINSLVYLTEGMRGAPTPELPDMLPPVSRSALLLTDILFWIGDARGVRTRVLG